MGRAHTWALVVLASESIQPSLPEFLNSCTFYEMYNRWGNFTNHEEECAKMNSQLKEISESETVIQLRWLAMLHNLVKSLKF